MPYFAAKTNANFPDNGPRHGLPTNPLLAQFTDVTVATAARLGLDGPS